ncbi:MAG: PGF-pre-PGF domain-containing protein [Alphaproteobacteria bacterium]|nr:MAG: PGF-pre-PGF domain-containing protein [Alphaproteobacteria bacterium]
MKVDFFNSIISTLVTTLILGLIPVMAFALDVQSDVGNSHDLNIGNSSKEDLSYGKSGGDGNYGCTSNCSGINYKDSKNYLTEDRGNIRNSNTIKSCEGNFDTAKSANGENEGYVNRSSSSNSLELDNNYSEELDYNYSEELGYNYSEELDYNYSEELDYNYSEELGYNYSEELDYNYSEELDYFDFEGYPIDGESYTYYSSDSNLDMVRELSWMGIAIMEPEDNIYAKELAIRNVMGGHPVRFDFKKNATCITHIEFYPLMTFRKTTSTAEVLKDVSVFVPELPTGVIYQYTNIFVGNKGAGLPASLKNGLVGFKIERSWIKDNNINESLVTLQWYNKSWKPLYTEKIGEDNDYLYFKSKTPGFSFFVITENTGEANGNYTGEIDENYTEEVDGNYTEEDESYTEDENYKEETDKNCTEETDENCKEIADVNYTGKADLNYTEEADKNCTGTENINCKEKTNENCTGKIDKYYTERY